MTLLTSQYSGPVLATVNFDDINKETKTLQLEADKAKKDADSLVAHLNSAASKLDANTTIEAESIENTYFAPKSVTSPTTVTLKATATDGTGRSATVAIKVVPGPTLSWKAIPETGTDLAIAANGATWIVGSNATAGGFGVRRSFDGMKKWEDAPGGLSRIAISAGGQAWGINDKGVIFSYSAGWQAMLGKTAKDISVGADGSVWIIGDEPVAGGFAIYRLASDKSGWTKIDGGGVRIAVTPYGNPWVVNDAGDIYARINGKWTKKPGSAKDIAIGPSGAVWVVGTNAAPGGFGVHYLRELDDTWIAGPAGGGVSVAVGPEGYPCVVSDKKGLSCLIDTSPKR